jgi:hypothetical protein
MSEPNSTSIREKSGGNANHLEKVVEVVEKDSQVLEKVGQTEEKVPEVVKKVGCVHEYAVWVVCYGVSV